MPREFKIDDYQYTEEHITFDQWVNGYKPNKNHLDPDATFNGTLYKHAGAEWDHIVQLHIQEIWSLYEEDGILKIKNGYQVPGRLGYFHCPVYHNPQQTIIVDNVPPL